MTLRRSFRPLRSDLDKFLFAAVGDEIDGIPLSMISALTRLGLDPWQEAGRLSVIADDGAVLEPYVSRRFLSLPLVVGKGAETQARDFLALLARYPQVNSITKAAIFVGERRWNLRLKDGLDIRLPEQDVGNALAMLSRLDKEDKLFSRDIVAVGCIEAR